MHSRPHAMNRDVPRLYRRIVKSLIVAALLLVVVPAASSSTTATPGLRLGYYAAPATLDPQKSNINFTWRSWSLSYECLLRTTPGGDVEPSLATSYTQSKNRLVYDFTLRRNVRFHDGSAFNSSSVIFSFNRLRASGVPYAKNLFANLATVRALGRYKVRFTLTKPTPGFLLNMGNPYAVACAIMSPRATATKMVGTGPWQQVAYTPNQSLQVKRFSNYWGTKAASPTLTVFFIPEASGMLAALQAGRIDIGYPDASVLPALRSNKSLKLTYTLSPTVYDLCLNNGGQMADVRVRQALLLSIDAQKFARQAWLGYGNPSGAIPARYLWAPRVKQYTYSHGHDVARAKQLLAAAGHPNGITLNFIYPTDLDPVYDRGAQILQSQVADAGIKLNLQPYDVGTWVGHIVDHTYDMFATPQPWFADPGEYIRSRSDEHSNPDPPTVQALWNSALAAPNTAEYYKRLARVALEQDRTGFNYIGLAAATVAVAYRSGLKNVSPDFTQTWLYVSGVSR